MNAAGDDSLTDVSGLRVGHAEVAGGESGCTVVLGPFRGVVEVRGSATGTRELGTLDPSHLVAQVDAILLTGGSAFGLAAADGVMAWLAERGAGFHTGSAVVPIVPAAVLFDLAPGRLRPDAALGRAACDCADAGPVVSGRVGAGAGATVGKLFGPQWATPGGIGSASRRMGRWSVGALAAVNALGEVSDREGKVVAGVRGGAASSEKFEAEEGPRAGENTTLAVVATDAPLGPPELVRWLRVASTALARRIAPVHTPFDGDVVFALTTGSGGEGGTLGSPELLRLGVAAREALESAILRAVGSR